METLTQELANFGFSAVAFGVIVLLLMQMMKNHKEERGEWKDEMVQMNMRYDERQKETNTILSELHRVIDRVSNK